MDTRAAKALLAQMCARSHVAPKRLTAPGPSADELNLIFSAAAQAPDHGRIQPWRFIVIPPEQRHALGLALLQALQGRDPQAQPHELDTAYDKASRAPCLMLAVVNHAPCEPEIPVYERLISLGCAIQNMLLMAQTLAISSGITSGKSMNAPSIRQLFKLKEDEQGICYLAFGRATSHKPPRARPASLDFVSSLP